ncbi:MAG: hypothetical protein FWE36_05230 [Erysipelotrichales bacterium]|nr:hypothetical protein [Erysipelotrichales bacterium]
MVSLLGDNVFRDSVHLQTVDLLRARTAHQNETRAGSNFLANTHPNLSISVPDVTSLNAYRNAANWSVHAHRMWSRYVHVCNHVLEPFCNTYHWFICWDCGDYFFERHSWFFDWSSNMAFCTVCGLALPMGMAFFMELLEEGFDIPLAFLKEFNELEYLN